MFKILASKFKSRKNKTANLLSDKVLWDYLDECGIEFRETQASLITKYGSRNCGWTDSLDYCEIDSRQPFLEHLSHPIVFQFMPRLAQDTYPTSLSGYIRDSENAYENFALAQDQLTSLFGPGLEKNMANATMQVWKFRKAEIKIHISPPELNNRPNSRHQSIPGSATECSISIETAFCPPPSAEELKILESLYPNKQSANSPQALSPVKPSRTKRRLSVENSNLTAGRFSLDGSKENLVHIIDTYNFHILPVDWIEEIYYHSIKPAKGRGGIYLRVYFQTPAQRESIIPTDSPISPHRLRDRSEIILIRADYSEDEYFDVAKKLSDDLGLPLTRYDDYDC